MGHLLDWYTDPEKFQGEVNLKVITSISTTALKTGAIFAMLPKCMPLT